MHINESDVSGGAARSAYRAHEGLRRAGHRSRMLVGRKLGVDPDVRRLKRSAAWRAVDRPFGALTEALDLQYVLYPSSFAVAWDPWLREADVVQLHLTHGHYFSHTALPLISRRRPVVWELHDMFAVTGHAAYTYDCDRWLHGCGSCPYMREYPPLRRDTTALLWRIKRAAYARSRLTLVAPSRWLADIARVSPLLGRFTTHHIPYGLDTDVFRPRPQAEARRRLGLPAGGRLVLFAAARLDEPRKGLDLLADAVARLGGIEFELAVVGSADAPPLPRPAHMLGTLATEEQMADAYAAADVFVLPTRADNLPNALLESIACGTPCVAFAVGGVPEIVREGVTGYPARPEDPADLAAGIRLLLDDDELRSRLRSSCREVAEDEYRSDLQARRLGELYEEVARAA